MAGFTFLFEISWETCNKVGGIYTVIKSKLAEVKRNLGDNYCLIGPLFDNNPEFEETDDSQAKDILQELRRADINAKVGRWKTESRPLVILVGYKDALDQGKLLYQLWEDYSVDSMTGGWDYVEPVMFSTMAARAIEAASNVLTHVGIVAQFHEWLAGAGLLYIKKHVPRVSTIFTTHATIVGRSLSGRGVDIYKILADIQPDAEAAKCNVLAKHSLEKAAAREADCFTTVSEITAIEAKYLLKMDPDVVLPNGFSVSGLPAYDKQPQYFHKQRQRLLTFASQFLQRPFDEEETVIISTSGRYEFHNKGLDVFLDALGQLAKAPEALGQRKLLVYLLVLTGAVDISRRKNDGTDAGRLTVYSQLSTHPLWDPNNDPIINTCQRHGLVNGPHDRINVIFVPVYLNGADGVLNLDYYATLAGCDLTVYPSYYEPWGYTPLESIAYSIPTVSTDVAGFGRWILSAGRESEGIKILKRFDTPYNDTVAELKTHIVRFSGESRDNLKRLKQEARGTALGADWRIFFAKYLSAFESARRESRNRLQGRLKPKIIEFKEIEYRGADSQRPRFRKFSVNVSIPGTLSRLRDLAYNLWWTWNPQAQELFALLNPGLYTRLRHNPVAFLEAIAPERLDEAARDEKYREAYKSITAEFDAYIKEAKCLVAGGQEAFDNHPVAYFSMEYGFHECLPIYSGGLGILSGDHIKSASDLGINLVAIGLLYKNGYFKQGISRDGDQLVEYYVNDFFRMPLQELHQDGEKVIVSIEFPGRKVSARVWEARVGRVPVYLFDTDISENSPADRAITAKLYGGGAQVRIEQEILLGIGGIRLLERLRVTPSVYHLNEGHSAFLIVERLIHLIKIHNLDLETAKEVIKQSTVFTTHTPVPAGNEAFDMPMVENYLKNYVESQGVAWQEIYELGHKSTTDSGPFEMTALALKNTTRRNGVSRLHGTISRKMWADIWSSLIPEEVPIGHITNGVHAGTWITSEMRSLITTYCSLNLERDLLSRESWKKTAAIPDERLWKTHLALKDRLYKIVKERVTQNWTREGEDPALLDRFLDSIDPTPLTIGFARRFATYKRATLFLRNMDRLKKLVTNPKLPVQFLFAGKAHPNDKAAFSLIKEIVSLSKQEEFLGKIIFIENYDMRLARRFISGVDVWLNNPRRPLEASGTSGQKAGMNGALNLSILDGWWDEAYSSGIGWAVGDRKEYKHPATQDSADYDSLFEILEKAVVPLYYARNSHGVPDKWVQMMKHSLGRIIAGFNTHRMVAEYAERMYIPSARRYHFLREQDFVKAKEIAQWKKSARARFSSIHINHIAIQGIDGDMLDVGDEIQFLLEVHKGRMTKDELQAEVLIFQEQEEEAIEFTGGELSQRDNLSSYPLEAVEESETVIKYVLSYKAQHSGKFNYGIRILPYHPDADDIKDLNLVFWG
ncbi:MAG: alpha-glucan family phosphorylase [Spirochaetales bacterium]|nr:alpha-glucan family phosphorylase [Spirochaetales bacterium]